MFLSLVSDQYGSSAQPIQPHPSSHFWFCDFGRRPRHATHKVSKLRKIWTVDQQLRSQVDTAFCCTFILGKSSRMHACSVRTRYSSRQWYTGEASVHHRVTSIFTWIIRRGPSCSQTIVTYFDGGYESPIDIALDSRFGSTSLAIFWFFCFSNFLLNQQKLWTSHRSQSCLCDTSRTQSASVYTCEQSLPCFSNYRLVLYLYISSNTR